jgi:redox-sensitive bicupin YhaK (pirin superfamily)
MEVSMTTNKDSGVVLVRPMTVLEGAGVRLQRSLGTPQFNYHDPFLLFDDFSSPNSDDYVRGFPWHPHRGIETVTYILSGQVKHLDSLGNGGVLGAGDVQWMSSGSGIMHEEMPQPTAEPLIGFQLWVNLPAKEKMSTPRYQNIASHRIPTVVPGGGVSIRVVAGWMATRPGRRYRHFADVSGRCIRTSLADNLADSFRHFGLCLRVSRGSMADPGWRLRARRRQGAHPGHRARRHPDFVPRRAGRRPPALGHGLPAS